MVVGSLLGGPVGAFIGSLIGSLLATGLTALWTKRGTDTEVAKVNVRISEPIRWLNAGRTRQGGAVLFAEFDGSGNLWYLVVHCDSILVTSLQYYLDSVPVTLNESGVVQNKEFRLKNNKEKDPAETDGEGTGYVQIWTTTHTESDPTPAAIAALAAAFPSMWTSDHKLVGTTYSVVKVTALKDEHRHKIYRWRGALGMGEPSISIVGEWSHAYDPRDVGQAVDDATTHLTTRNPVLIWAWFRRHRYGRNKPHTSINWDRVAEQADICDEIVTGVYDDHTRYRCDIAIPEDQARSEAERLIMMSMDAQLVYDADGKCWPRAGYYEVPTLKLTRNRDIVAMESAEADNGESETQGVIVRYTDPDADYAMTASAPWYNPIYYIEGEAATFAQVDVPTIQDHNQAMRIAKAIGMRLQPSYKLVPTCGLRGLKAMRERIVDILYDNTFTGDHEIVTQVEIDKSGILCRFGIVPVDEDRWELVGGEELPKPVMDGSTSGQTYPAATMLLLTSAESTIILEMDVLPRPDGTYLAEYIPTILITGDDNDPWQPMVFNGLIATSDVVEGDVEYTVRWRYVTSSGQGPAWDDDTITPPLEVIEYDGGDATGV